VDATGRPTGAAADARGPGVCQATSRRAAARGQERRASAGLSSGHTAARSCAPARWAAEKRIGD